VTKPDFFVIGASKCGTTSLCKHLGDHPRIFFSDPKEPMFFTRAEELGRTTEWYEALFEGAAGHAAVGEGSTNYAAVSLFPGVEERIAAYSPGARILYIVRHPLERMESQWLQMVSGGMTGLGFDAAIRELPEMIETNLFLQTADAYRRAFGDERMLVLFFDDFKLDPRATVTRCFRFLGVDPDVPLVSPERAHNPRSALRRDKPLIRRLRNAPGFELLRSAVPQRARSVLRLPFTRGLTPRPEWMPETLAWVEERIVDDNRQFLRRYGKPADFWTYGGAWLTGRRGQE